MGPLSFVLALSRRESGGGAPVGLRRLPAAPHFGLVNRWGHPLLGAPWARRAWGDRQLHKIWPDSASRWFLRRLRHIDAASLERLLDVLVGERSARLVIG